MTAKTILLVEDNQDDRDLTLLAFRQCNIPGDVTIAEDGVIALDYLFGTGTHAGRDVTQMPSVVLLDLKLPRLDGFEVLRRIRADERTRPLPVVILTSSAEDRDLAQGYALGCNSYVRKPVVFSQFAEAIRQLGLYWLELNKTPPPAAG